MELIFLLVIMNSRMCYASGFNLSDKRPTWKRSFIQIPVLSKIQKSKWLPSPVFAKAPETGLALGLGLFYSPQWNKDTSLRRSGLSWVAAVTQQKQYIFSSAGNISSLNDQFMASWNLGARKYFDRYYGIGNENSVNTYTNFRFNLLSLQASGLLRISKSSHFIGPQIRWQTMNEIKWDITPNQMPPGGYGYHTAGFGFRWVLDRRNELINPTQGSYIEFGYRIHPRFRLVPSKDFLEAVALNRIPKDTLPNPSYQQWVFDYRAYIPLFRSVNSPILASRCIVNFSGPGTPFREIPSLGGSATMRGLFLGSYRDYMVASLENEIRYPINSFIGINLYTGLGHTGFQNPRPFQKAPLFSSGFGLRLTPNPRNRTLLRLDWAYASDGQKGFYIELNENF